MRYRKTQKFIEEILKKKEENQLTEECILWPYANNKNEEGYGFVNWNKKREYVHRKILCLITDKEYENDFEAAHSCGNSLCVNPLHLSWKTTSENEKDKIEHGTLRFGEKHPNMKLTSKDVSNIRNMKKSMTYREIAEYIILLFLMP